LMASAWEKVAMRREAWLTGSEQLEPK